MHWSANHRGTSHVVILGHGVDYGLQFMANGGLTSVRGRVLADRPRQLAPDTPAKTFISLACRTGRAAFAKPFSESSICRDFIGPWMPSTAPRRRTSASPCSASTSWMASRSRGPTPEQDGPW